MDNAEVCVVELELDDAIARKRGGHRALDDGDIGNDAAVDLVDLDAGASRLRRRAAPQQITLPTGIHLAVGPFEPRPQPRPAAQAFAITHGIHHPVNRYPGTPKT